MVKLVAKKGVNTKNLKGIKELLNADATDISINSTNTKITFQSGAIKIQLFGDSFNLLSLSGTLQKAVVKVNGNEWYRLTNMNIDISTLLNASTPTQVAKKVFKGADVIIGSNQNDILNGFGHNDTIRGKNGKDNLVGGPGADSGRREVRS